MDIDVPSYELPLPEGVVDDKFQQEHKSMREIEESWKERLQEPTTVPTTTTASLTSSSS